MIKINKFAFFVSFFSLLNIFQWALLPIWSDEISYLYFSSRWLIEGARIQIWPLCFDERIVDVPFYLWPNAAFLSVWSYIENPVFLRIVAIAFNLGSLLLIANKFAYFYRKNLFLTFLFLAGLQFGLISLLIVSHRAEYLFLPLVSLGLYALDHRDGKILKQLLFLIALSFLYICANFIHPKYLFLLPLVILVIAKAYNQQNKFYILLISFYVLISSYAMYEVNHKQFLSCSNLPAMAEINKSYNINPAVAFSSPKTFFSELVENNSIDRFDKGLRKIGFDASYIDQASFLPDYKAGTLVSFIRSILNGAAAFFSFVNLLIFFIIFLMLPWLWLKAKNCLDKNNIEFVFLASLSLVANILLNKAQARYDYIFWIFCCTILNLISFAILFKSKEILTRPFRFHKLICILVVMLLSVNALYIGASVDREIVKGRNLSGINLVKLDYSDLRVQQDKLFQQYGVTSSDFILTDDTTYFLNVKREKATPITWLWYGLNLNKVDQNLSEEKMYKALWQETEVFARENNIKYAVVLCPSMAIEFDKSKLHQGSSEWDRSICVYDMR
jgi:hypothetical protein